MNTEIQFLDTCKGCAKKIITSCIFQGFYCETCHGYCPGCKRQEAREIKKKYGVEL